MSIVPKFLLTFFSGGLVRPIWERVSALYLDFLGDTYIVEGTPSTFDSYVTHSRNGNATMTDSDGLIKWAPHNLLTYSEDFSNATWSNISGVQPYLVSGVGPNGEDAYKVESGTGWADLNQYSVGDVGQTLTGKVYIKSVDGTTGTFSMFFSSADSVGGLTIPSDWTEISSSKLTTSPTSFSIRSATKDFYILRAQVYRSDLGGMVDNPDRGDSYVPTTSSAVYLPRRGHHVYNGSTWVNEGLLVESESRANIALYSNDISETTTGWTANDTITAVATGITGIDGVSGSPFKLIEGSGGTDQYRQNQQYVTISTDYAVCAILKDAGDGVYAGLIGLGIGGANEVPVFDLVNGTVDVAGTTTVVKEAGIYPWNDDGWYFCWARVTSGGTAGVSVSVHQSATDNTSSSYTYTGDGTSGYYVAYVGCEQTSGMPSFPIPTAGSAITRAAETLTIPSANLPYPTPNVIGSELVTNGTFDTDISGWNNFDPLRATISYDSGTLKVDNTTGTGDGYIYQNNLAFIPGDVVLITATYSNTTLDAKFYFINSSNVGIGSVREASLDGSGIATWALLVPATATGILLGNEDTASPWNIDNISVKEIDPLSVSIQMDGRMTYADNDDNAEIVYLNWETGTEQISYRLRTDSTRTGAVQILQRASAVLDTVETASGTVYSPDILVPFNIASRHGSTFVNGAIEGTALTANTTPVALPDLSSTDLELAYDYMGTIRTFRIWDADLTDEGIAYVSERSEEPTISLSFNSSESSFTVSDWLP